MSLITPLTLQSNGYLPDSDGDRLGDGVQDANRGAESGWLHTETDTRDEDTDEDGYEDGIEVLHLLSDPLNPASPSQAIEDEDEDALPDSLAPNDGAVDPYMPTNLPYPGNDVTTQPGAGDHSGPGLGL